MGYAIAQRFDGDRAVDKRWLAMADNDKQFQERTEQATPKRLQEAREKGQIPRSRELTMATVMIAAALIMTAIQGELGGYFVDLLRQGLSFDATDLVHTDSMTAALSTAALESLSAFAPLMIGLTGAATLGGMSVGGWAFSANPMAPKLSKLNPIKGLKRVFGLKGLVEVGKALGKAFVVGAGAVAFMTYASDRILGLSVAPLEIAMINAGGMVLNTLLICSFSLIAIALVDVPYQIWNHKKELRMTRKEVQDEMKETDGRPEVRSRIRAIQQEMASKRMLEEVPLADVVITNPMHFAVALKYDTDVMRAPVVVAKGMDHLAAQIRELADENNVTMFESPLLARALYWTTEVGQEIPGQLYLAVAQVLTYVFGLRTAGTNGVPWPEPPQIEIDKKLAERPIPGQRSGRRAPE